MLAINAESRSLSPKRISLDARESFSLIEQPVEGASHVAVLLWGDGVGHSDEDLPDAQSVL